MIRLRKAVGTLRVGGGIGLLVYSEAEYERRSGRLIRCNVLTFPRVAYNLGRIPTDDKAKSASSTSTEWTTRTVPRYRHTKDDDACAV